nr:hypothetical protein [Tanacetum cinerariifolium]
MPPKPDLVFHTAPIAIKTGHSAFTVQLSPTKPAQDLSHTHRPTAPIIEDWVSDSEDESETKAPQIVPSFVQSSETCSLSCAVSIPYQLLPYPSKHIVDYPAHKLDVALEGELLVFGDGLQVRCLRMGDLDLVTIGWAYLGRVTLILGTTTLTIGLTAVIDTGLD